MWLDWWPGSPRQLLASVTSTGMTGGTAMPGSVDAAGHRTQDLPLARQPPYGQKLSSCPENILSEFMILYRGGFLSRDLTG